MKNQDFLLKHTFTFSKLIDHQKIYDIFMTSLEEVRLIDPFFKNQLL